MKRTILSSAVLVAAAACTNLKVIPVSDIDNTLAGRTLEIQAPEKSVVKIVRVEDGVVSTEDGREIPVSTIRAAAVQDFDAGMTAIGVTTGALAVVGLLLILALSDGLAFFPS